MADLPLDLLGCVCASPYVHEYLRLMFSCASCSSNALGPAHGTLWCLRLIVEVSSRPACVLSGLADRVLGGGSFSLSSRRKWSDVRQLGWPDKETSDDIEDDEDRHQKSLVLEGLGGRGVTEPLDARSVAGVTISATDLTPLGLAPHADCAGSQR